MTDPAELRTLAERLEWNALEDRDREAATALRACADEIEAMRELLGFINAHMDPDFAEDKEISARIRAALEVSDE